MKRLWAKIRAPFLKRSIEKHYMDGYVERRKQDLRAHCIKIYLETLATPQFSVEACYDDLIGDILEYLRSVKR
ncbi:hypothetical protein LCGC14_0917340 [marine sediment metagenome]|uniref:Uncharacterized protein n=1 Tax=marine sediment metagenome TaxID=412755 RepID=A0A0F9RYI5_9ZZZZ